MTFIDKENLIITEKNGGLLKINVITKKSTKLNIKLKVFLSTEVNKVDF